MNDPDAIELYCEETEGWPHDGQQTTLVFVPPERFVLTTTRRHIDADGERGDVEVLDPAAGLAWARAAGVSIELLGRPLAALDERLELVAELGGGEGGREQLRRIGEVWLLRSVARDRALDELESNGDRPVTGVIEALVDRLDAWRLGVDVDAFTAPDGSGEVVRWAWLAPDDARERLRAAKWTSEQITAAFG